MDRWGPDGCRSRLNEIVRYIVNQLNQRKRDSKGLDAKAKLLVATIPNSMAPVLAKRLVKKAIRLAEKEAS